MKKIIIATDFSSHSKHATQCILKFLGESKIPISVLLLNTYLLLKVASGDDIIKINDQLKEISQKNLAHEKKQILDMVKERPITVEISSRIGSLPGVIEQLIQKEHYDFIVMGKNGGENVLKVSKLLKKNKGPSLFVTYT